MRKLKSFSVVIFCLGFSVSASLAQVLNVEKGEINFTSNAQLELIKASSDQVRGLIKPATNQFAFEVVITTFKGFNSDLQRHHFNDNYMESDKFPKATFSGKIIEQVDFTRDSIYDVRAKGTLDIHGQKQTRIIKGKLVVHKGQTTIESHFSVLLNDHQISIPKIVSQKIATEIEVTFRVTLVSQK